ncbi:uncharacterized protein Dwil_GK18718 [Drosophila willistoni]|uniref:Gustatory receptor n=1 Tax=Drosophila willistoni TaxID=7260 RepID=B4N7L5_DROWI|nr:uncharacterized protein LOC6646703 [Drosophila willistoni]EDW80354.2 uncharacterized protein Dwil_GK18718 [Drosophila willistoni]
MNYSRVLRATNILLILTGYQLHWFDRKSRRFEISLIAVVNVFVLGCLYAACFAQHFRPSSMLKVLHDVSPLLYGLTRVQLMLGLKVFAYAIYSSARAVVGINSLIESFPADGRALNKAESIAYGFLGSTLSVLFGFGVYIAYKMDFKLPLLQEAMIGMALFLPHLALGGSVRLYCILAWLSCVRLKQLKREVVEEFSTNLKRDEADSASTSFSISQPPVTRSNSDGLELKRRQLESLRNRFNFFFRDMQFSLLFLCTINANCLLSGAYSYVNFTNSWHLLFEERKQRIFYAANASIYACIGCDYMCLLLAQVLMEKELLLLQCLTIALVIVFHYLNDEIIQLKEQLESMNDE